MKPFKNLSNLLLYLLVLIFVLLFSGMIFIHCKAQKEAIYDLTWSVPDANDSSRTYHRWRYLIDVKTKLPVRIEKFSKKDLDSDFILDETLIVEYPSDQQMLENINEFNR